MKFSAAAARTTTAACALSLMSLLFLLLKLFVRGRVVRSLGWDDALAVLSFVASIPVTAALYHQARHGMGYHIQDTPPPDLVIQLRWLWASTFTYCLSLGLSKMSILVQYLRIFIARRTVYAIWGTIAFVVAYTIQSIIVGIFSCNPPQKFWMPPVKGFCIDYIVYYYVAAALNIVTDFAIILVPVPALRTLHMSRNKKIGLIFLFSIGGFGCIVSLVRLWTLTKLAEGVTRQDPGFYNPLPALWSAIEIHICIVCACMPSLSPVLTRGLKTLGLHKSSGARTPQDNSWRRWTRKMGTGSGSGSGSAQNDLTTFTTLDSGPANSSVYVHDIEEGGLELESRNKSTAATVDSMKLDEPRPARVAEGRTYHLNRHDF